MYLYHGFLRIYRNDIQLLCIAIANDAFLLAFFSIFHRIRLHFSSLSIDAWSRSFVLGSIRADLEKKKGDDRAKSVKQFSSPSIRYLRFLPTGYAAPVSHGYKLRALE